MNSKEINDLKRKRASLATKIREWKERGKNAKELAIEYQIITEKLQQYGLNVFIGADYLKEDYWDNFYLGVLKPTVDVKVCKIKTEKEYTQQRPTTELVDDKIKAINYYSICLAWECKDIQESPNGIKLIKNCFNDLGLKEISDEYYQMGSCVEYMSKYRFIGDDDTFNIIKTFTQSVLDSIALIDDNKNNTTIFGKKINI